MPTTIKTRSVRVLTLPTPADDAALQRAAQVYLNVVPLTDAEWAQVKPLVCRGSPLGSGSKTQVTLRLDLEVLERFRASGEGWQTRINETPKSWVRTPS